MTERVQEERRWTSKGADFEDGVRCVVAPCCAFTFDADHFDNGGETYSCPACGELQALAAQAKAAAELLLLAKATDDQGWAKIDPHTLERIASDLSSYEALKEEAKAQAPKPHEQ